MATPQGNSRVLITSNHRAHASSNLPYSIGILNTIPSSKIRIRIPKILLKTMQRRRSDACSDGNSKKWAVPKLKKFIPKRVVRRFPNVFCSRRSANTCSADDREKHKCRKKYGVSRMNIHKDWSVVSSPMRLSQALHLRKIQEARDAKQRRLGNMKSFLQSRMAILVKGGRFTGIGCSNISESNGEGENHCRSRGFAGPRVSGKEENLGRSAWAAVRRSASFRRKKEVLGQSEAAAGQENAGQESEGYVLWKKRILLGRRCKPLDLQGTFP